MGPRVSELEAGWYPNPDGSANERRWDGGHWTTDTRDYPPPATAAMPSSAPDVAASPERPRAVGLVARLKRMPRWLSISIVAALVLGIVIAASVAFALSSAEDKAEHSTSPTNAPRTPGAAPPPAVSAPVAPAPTPQPALIPMGAPIVSPNYSLVIDSVEILDRIETTSGGPILADAGTQLVLVHSTITITGNAQDLSCGSDLFIQAYDSNGSKMAEVFEGHRLPGNPECNFKTSAGQTVAWHFGYKIAAGRSPAAIAVIDTNVDGNYGWGQEIIASLQ